MNTNKEAETTPCTILNAVPSGFDFKKFNKDMIEARKQFAKACENYLKSKQHKAMIESFKKVAAID